MNNNGLGKFNCGSPVCPAMDFSKCPKELLLTNAAGKTIECLSVCNAP